MTGHRHTLQGLEVIISSFSSLSKTQRKSSMKQTQICYNYFCVKRVNANIKSRRKLVSVQSLIPSTKSPQGVPFFSW